jgi:hypothetical protein
MQLVFNDLESFSTQRSELAFPNTFKNMLLNKLRIDLTFFSDDVVRRDAKNVSIAVLS